MPLFKYTTTVAMETTIGEIQNLLAKGGATSVSTRYANKVIDSIEFTLALDGFPMTFRLGCNLPGVMAALNHDPDVQPRYRTRAHAVNVGWRILKEWVAAQVAIVECQQAEMAQVFLPFAVEKTPQGERCLFDFYREQRGLRLGSGEK